MHILQLYTYIYKYSDWKHNFLMDIRKEEWQHSGHCDCLATEGDAGEEGSILCLLLMVFRASETCGLLGYQHLRVMGHVTPPGSTSWSAPELSTDCTRSRSLQQTRTSPAGQEHTCRLSITHLSQSSKLPGALMSWEAQRSWQLCLFAKLFNSSKLPYTDRMKICAKVHNRTPPF